MERFVYSETTRNIRVSVIPEYLAEHSDPNQGAYAFSYVVKIENLGLETVQLLRRHWVVLSAGSPYTEVRGDGVVGEQPVLGCGDVYQYTSSSVIKDPMGAMFGSYSFRGEGEEEQDDVVRAGKQSARFDRRKREGMRDDLIQDVVRSGWIVHIRGCRGRGRHRRSRGASAWPCSEGNAGLSGATLNHSDIGGYTSFALPVFSMVRSEELLMRWMELNAFTTVFRTHEGNQRENNVHVDDTPQTRAAFAKNARLFKSLFEYRKKAITEAAVDGWPVVRPMWLEFPLELEVLTNHRKFMLGSDILVAPVLEPGKTTVDVFLPKGR